MSQTTSNNKLPVTTKAVKTLSADQMNILRTQIAPDITDNDLLYCLEVANNCQLNPIIKEIYFVPRKLQINGRWLQRYEPMIGRRGARAISRRKGMTIPPITGYMLKKFPKLIKGEWIEELDLVGWAELVINGQLLRKEAAYSVFKQTNKDGDTTKFWKAMPTLMCEKVAEFQLLDAVYGLDGLMSIDAGILEEDEPITTTVNVENEKDIIKALNALGISYKIENNLLIAKSNSTQINQTLKQLGFLYHNGQWQIEYIIDVDTIEESQHQNQIPQEDYNPAKELFNYLLNNGLNYSSAGRFVKDVLGLTSKDKDGCELALENKEILLEQIQIFLNPIEVQDDIDDIF